MSKKSRKKSSKTPSGSPTAKKTPVKTRAANQTKSRENTADIGEQINWDQRKDSIA